MDSMAFLLLSQVLVGGEGRGTGIAPTMLAGAEPLALLNTLPPQPKGTLGLSRWSQSCSVAGDSLASIQVSGRGELNLLGAYTALSPRNPRKPVLRRT